MKVLHLRTGCRLHFGLMELAAGEPMRFAGLGLMLDQPSFELAFSPAESPTSQVSSFEQPAAAIAEFYAADGTIPTLPKADTNADIKADFESRIRAAVQRRQILVCDAAQNLAPCHVRLLSALPLHSGLGAGTQLAASVAAGLELFARAQQPSANCEAAVSADNCPKPWQATAAPKVYATSATNTKGTSPKPSQTTMTELWQPVLDAQPTLTARWLSQHADRGLRSAVGLVGFLHGGLILDEGYTYDDAHAEVAKQTARPLAAQTLQLASEWRVVLMVPQLRAELSGAKEAEVMAELGSLSNPHRKQMLDLAHRVIYLAADKSNFAEFTDCLDQYMQFGAQLFSRYQGGIYNGADVTEAVQLAQTVGLRGVGQSSWGPTVFGFAASQSSAEHYAEILSGQRPDWSVRISTPANCGARYRWQSIHNQDFKICDS